MNEYQKNGRPRTPPAKVGYMGDRVQAKKKQHKRLLHVIRTFLANTYFYDDYRHIGDNKLMVSSSIAISLWRT